MDTHPTDLKRKLSVAITSPGWPLSRFPNGIVAYIHNLIIGIDAIANPIILAAPLLIPEVRNRLIDLDKLEVSRNIWQKLLDKILAKCSCAFMQKIQYQRHVAKNANKILLAVQQLQVPLDVLEVEESFGTASYLVKKNKLPVVTRLHGPWFLIGPIFQAHNEPQFKLRILFEGEAIKNSQGVTSPSLDVLNKVREYYGIALPNAQVIPNPVPEVPYDMQWQYSMSQKPSILFVGRFDLVKGGDLVLEAFRQIGLKNRTVELLFVGPDKGLKRNGEDFKIDNYIERFILDADIKKRIQFLGHCNHERISELRKNALVTIVCSRYETFSIALIESLAAGCPTVATAVGGMKEIIIDDYNGLLAEPESPESIAEKVLMLINDPEKMQRLSKNAIEDCKKRFSPEVVAAQTVDYYQSVLARVARVAT
ncbi:MAG: glycosyltransferase family 4 protein [Methylotenera sp.]|nr:glycosyltransferase family 4 protein [Methylotenera sp.]